jgi:hypothetical protein
VELWIWLGALGLGFLALVFALARLTRSSIRLAKKLKPFTDRLARFQSDTELYPEAIKFYSDLAKTQESPAKKLRNPKG